MRRWVALAAVAVAAVVPAAAQARAISWSDPVELGAPDDAQYRDVATGADGQALVVSVQGQRVFLDVPPYVRVVSVDDASVYPMSPVVASGPDGAAWVVWFQFALGWSYGEVWAAKVVPGVAPTPVRISAVSDGTYGVRYRPSVAALPDGTALIAWNYVDGTGDSWVDAARFDGTAVSDAAPDRPASMGTVPAVAVDADGRGYVAWIARDGAPPYVSAATWTVEAGWSAAATLSEGTGSAWESGWVQLAAGGHGHAIATWEADGGAGTVSVFASRFDDGAWHGTGGHAWEVAHNGVIHGECNFGPHVAMDGTGTSTVTFNDCSADDANSVAAVRSTVPGEWGAEVRIGDPPVSQTYTQTASLAATPSGSVVVAWWKSVYDGVATTYVVESARFDGGWSRPEVLPGQVGDGGQEPMASVGANGVANVIWYPHSGTRAILLSSQRAAPTPPLDVAAATRGRGASVTWAAPAEDGGAAVASYTATASPGGSTCTAAAPATTCTVTGLAPGRYTFSVVAANAVGDSDASAASAAVVVTGGSKPLRIRSVTRRGSRLVTLVRAPGAGVLRQVGRYADLPRALGMRAAIACRAPSVVVRRAGIVRLRCALTPAARAALRVHALRLRVCTSFAPAAGARQQVCAVVRLRGPATPVTG